MSENPGSFDKTEQNISSFLKSPQPDKAFTGRLRAELTRKAETTKSDYTKTTPFTRLIPRLAYALIILSLLGYFFGPGIVTAMRQLLGYVPGAGLVDESLPLRVLDKPQSVTRDGITLDVQQVVLSADKTVISFSLMHIPWESLSHQEDVPGCMGQPTLRLPGGRDLVSTSGGSTLNAYTFEFPPIPRDTNDSVLFLPCIQGTLPGKAPENWEVPLHFVPAPADFLVSPVIDVTAGQPQTAPADGSTAPTAVTAPETSAQNAPSNPMQLLKVVDLSDGYIFAGTFHAADLPAGADTLWPAGYYSVTDAQGRVIASTETFEQILPFPADPALFNWALQVKGKDFAYPLTISMDGAQASASTAAASFSFDTGPQPKVNQVFRPGVHFSLAGYDVAVDSITYDGHGYSFSFITDPLMTGMTISIAGAENNGGDGGGDGQGKLFTSLLYDDQPPAGKLTVNVLGAAFFVKGPWQVQWSPDSAQPGTVPSLFGIQPVIDQFIALPDGYYLAGHNTWTDKRISRVSPGGWAVKAYDSTGRQIPLEPVSASEAGLGALGQDGWVYRIHGTAFNGPVSLEMQQVELELAKPVSLDLDLGGLGFTGADDQLGYAWKVGMQPLDIPGLTARVQTLAYRKQGSLRGFDIFLVADNAIVLLPLEISGITGGQTSSGGSSRDAEGRLVSMTFTDGKFSPQFKLTARSLVISGSWKTSWTPPMIDPGAVPASVTPACLTLDKWKKVLQSPDAVPQLNGQLVLYGRIQQDGQSPNPQNYGVLIQRLDGSQKQVIGQGVNPSASADGSLLAYNWDDGLHVVDVQTGQDVLLPGLSPDDFGPKLSPDGSQLVFVRPADMNLYLVNTDGSGLTRFTGTASAEEYAQGWSADGSRLVYLRIESGQQSLVSKAVRSGEENTLFNFPAGAGGIALSPDGRQLAFTAPVQGSAAGGLYLADLQAGTAPVLLAQMDHWFTDAPLWSPDGQWLLLNVINNDAANAPATPALLNPLTCQVIPVNSYEGTAAMWLK